ncbi:hypothetical protein [Frankia sp. Cas3]|uniref:hypothetical protein n=1 Tax=Frankia sp. Cas3 TaxID=3073926 RepID=UPI002AD3AAD2|nr:hypothetical protein [Frankia sp. Cas3]
MVVTAFSAFQHEPGDARPDQINGDHVKKVGASSIGIRKVRQTCGVMIYFFTRLAEQGEQSTTPGVLFVREVDAALSAEQLGA